MYTYFDAEGSQVTPDTNISAASDGVCTRSKAVYILVLYGSDTGAPYLFCSLVFL